MSSFAFSTAGTIINEAAVEVGLAAVSDPYAETDQNFVQLRGLFKSLGQDIWRLKQWTQLQQVYTFSSVQGQGRYSLPLDFGLMIDQSGWNRSNSLPMGGPLSPQEWEYLKGRLVGVVFTVLFRPMNQQLWLFPDIDTPGGYAIAFEYISRFWVVPAATHSHSGPWSDGIAVTLGDYFTNGGNVYVATSTGTTGASGPTTTGSGISDGGVTWNYVSAWGAVAPAASTDVVLYDPLLAMRGLKLAWLKAKGFDTTSAQLDFDTTLEGVKGEDSIAPTLSLNSSSDGYLIGDKNVPITGFGS